MITGKDEIEKYYKDPSLNQSRLKTLLKGMESFKNANSSSELYFEENESFLIGSAVDALLTGTAEDFNDTYYVPENGQKPSDTVMSIINQVYDETKRLGVLPENVGSLSLYVGYVIQSCIKHDYYSTYKDETRIKKIIDCEYYWESLKKAEGKTVLSQEQYDKVKGIVDSLKASPFTSKYFTEGSDRRVYYQKPLYFTHRGVKCKALPDMIICYLENGIVTSIEIIDIKTMAGYTTNFPLSLRKYRYDIQAAWYSMALLYNLKLFGIVNDNHVKILPFKFIVESTTNIGNPVLFGLTKDLITIGRMGRAELRANSILVKTKIRGFESLIDEYLYYEKHGLERPMSINTEVVELEWDGIFNYNGY